MSKQGWISLHRKIQDNILWQDKPFSKGQAWIDLLLSANHKKNEVLLGNEVIEVEPGQFVTSIRKLADRWGWSNTKINNFFELLEKKDMATKKSDTKKTVIKVHKYKDYQGLTNYKNTSKTHQKHNENTSKTHQKHTNNNDNNDLIMNNNENNNSCSDYKNPNEVKFDEDTKPYKTAVYLRSKILDNNARQPVPDENPKDLEDWAVELDRLNRLGTVGAKGKGYSWEEIYDIIDWCQDDNFWKKNIKSAGKLREQVVKLEERMEDDNPKEYDPLADFD